MSDNKYQSPWGKKPEDDKNLSDLFSSNKLKMPKFNFPGTNFEGKNFLLLLVGAIFIVWLISGFFIVHEGQQAAITRFGKFVRIATAGPNYHFPYPIEKATKIYVDNIQKEEIGYRSTTTTGKHIGFAKSAIDKVLPEESLMLTGDENILDINFSVQWQIANLEDYLYNVENVRETVKSAAESAMREVIGSTPMAYVQTEGRAQAEVKTKELLQRMLDEYKSGVQIVNLQLEKVDPPTEVIDAFRDVQTAKADKERAINKAEAYRNSIIPEARGEAAKILQEALGYKMQVTDKAQGDAKRFNEIYAEYKKSKDVTKKRMYIDAIEEMIKDNRSVIISNDLSRSVVPYLPLNKLRESK